MARKAKAVVCRELNKPVVVEEIRVDSPRRSEVTVKLSACGVCHSDLSATNGTIALPPPRVHDRAGSPLGIFSGCGVMAEYATMSVENVIRIDPKIPLDRAALVGCAVATGAVPSSTRHASSPARRSRCSAAAGWAST